MTVHYLAPGPSRLPPDLLREIRDEMIDTFGIGVSVLEIAARSVQYESLSEETILLARRVLGVPHTHEILLSPQGAQQHFSLLVHHLSRSADVVAYADTCLWASLALSEARDLRPATAVVFSGAPSYSSLGDGSAWTVPTEAKYLHLTVNNTAYGTEIKEWPASGDVPLVLDMTSSIAARTDVPWDRVDMIYASAQKNLGVAGASVVIMRAEKMNEARRRAAENGVGRALNYVEIFGQKSIFNTPPVFAIFVLNRMLRWIEREGGVPEMERRALDRSRRVYEALDAGLYRPRADRDCRSRHNFVFDLRNESDTDRFLLESTKAGLLEIKGHRRVGGIRCSLYNGHGDDSAKALVDFLNEYRRTYG